MQDATLPRVLVRAAECELLSRVRFPRPLLDVGSGDGSFAAALFEEPVDVGLDPWMQQVRYSRGLGVYNHLVVASGEHMPFPDGKFASVMSNSTLEHTVDPRPILKEMARVSRAGADCYVTVPSEHFPRYLFGSSVLDSVGLRRPADAYARFMNRVSRHIHIEPPATWQAWLAEAGFEVADWRYYFSRLSTMALDIGHYVSAPSIVTHGLLGRWVLWPGKTRYLPYRRLLAPLSRPGKTDEGAYLFFHAIKA